MSKPSTLNRYRPSAADKRIIREQAAIAARCDNVSLRTAYRAHENGGDEKSINALLVADKFLETIAVESSGWDVFVNGVPLRLGDAIVDFYVYDTGGDRSLITNVQAHIEQRALVRVTEGRRVVWSA